MSTPAPFTPAPVKDIVAREDLDKLDIRVGTIVSVEDVPRSEKLIKLTVNLKPGMTAEDQKRFDEEVSRARLVAE